MAELSRPDTLEAYQENFQQIKPVMNPSEAYFESGRCLFCYDAPCIEACPTGIDIPLFIRQINNGNVSGAARTIYNANYFGNICGKVCPTEVLCEGACVYNNQNVKPIEIGRLQSYATTSTIKKNKRLYKPAPPTGKRIAVIGAGPAGLSCACELRLQGHEVDVFEADTKPSGLTYYGIAPYKIRNEEVFEEMNYLESTFGYAIEYEHRIDAEERNTILEQYDAVMIGIGLGGTSETDLPGEHLPGCIGATEFIRNLKTKAPAVEVGNHVVVLGGGNTAMDAASESARMGAESVVLAYRRSKGEKRAYDFEYDLAKNVGVRGIFNAAPKAVLGNTSVTGVRLIKTEVVEGKIREIPGTEFELSCDMVIRATGQEKQEAFLSSIPGLELDRGKVVIDVSTGRTGNPKVFAAGDAVNGGKEVVNAVAEGKTAALGIDLYLASFR